MLQTEKIHLKHFSIGSVKSVNGAVAALHQCDNRRSRPATIAQGYILYVTVPVTAYKTAWRRLQTHRGIR